MIFPQFFIYTLWLYCFCFYLFLFFSNTCIYIFAYIYVHMKGRFSIFVYKQLNHAQLFSHNNNFFFIIRGGTLRDVHIYHYIHNIHDIVSKSKSIALPIYFCVLCLHIIITQYGLQHVWRSVYDDFMKSNNTLHTHWKNLNKQKVMLQTRGYRQRKRERSI